MRPHFINATQFILFYDSYVWQGRVSQLPYASTETGSFGGGVCLLRCLRIGSVVVTGVTPVILLLTKVKRFTSGGDSFWGTTIYTQETLNLGPCLNRTHGEIDHFNARKLAVIQYFLPITSKKFLKLWLGIIHIWS